MKTQNNACVRVPVGSLKNVEVHANRRVSESIFFDQMPDPQKSIYVVVKDNSNKFIGIMPKLRKILRARGYRVIKNPNKADYILQTDILRFEKMSDAVSQEVLVAGYGSSIIDALGISPDLLINDVNYRVIADVQIDEWVGKGLRTNLCLSTENDIEVSDSQTSRTQRQYQCHQARIITSIDQASSNCVQVLSKIEQTLVEVLMEYFND